MIELKLKFRKTQKSQFFLSLCHVFWRFTPVLVRFTAPFNKKMRNDQRTHLAAVNFKDKDTVVPLLEASLGLQVLTWPRSEGQYTLDTDACDEQINGTYLQKQVHRSNCSNSYWSRTLLKEAQTLAATERQCLTVVRTVLLLGRWLE